jgi:flavin-binding protein dodecin
MAKSGSKRIETYLGFSSEGFDAATQKAVEEYEKKHRPRKPTELRVVDMYVVVTNPIRDYRVALSPDPGT